MEVKKGILVLIIFFLVNCKKNENNKTKEKQVEPVFKKEVTKKEFKYNINDIQGIWDSFSYYLEHENEFKDFHQNKYYKIIFNNKSLDIKYQDIDNLSIKRYYLGFWKSTYEDPFNNKDLFIKSLKDSGNILVRLDEDKEYNYSIIEKSLNVQRYFEFEEILNDGFDYGKSDYEFNFKTNYSLPKKIFSKLKEKSKLDNIDYLKDYGIYSLSKKVKVKVGKTYFHNETTEESKRKAFLVKGDIAYVEEILDEWIKVYYNGSIVSGGFIKRSDLEILN